MKLHKTRDGETKTREVMGAPHVNRLSAAMTGALIGWADERGASWALTMTDEEAEALAASILEAVPVAGEREDDGEPVCGCGKRARDATHVAGCLNESRDMGVPLRLQTQGGLPDRPESVGPIRETSHAVALAAWDESVGHPLREAILAGFAEHRDADRLLRESQEVEAMGRRFARALRRGR